MGKFRRSGDSEPGSRPEGSGMAVIRPEPQIDFAGTTEVGHRPNFKVLRWTKSLLENLNYPDSPDILCRLGIPYLPIPTEVVNAALQQGTSRPTPCLRLEPSPAEGIVEAETSGKYQQKIRIEQHTFTGGLWCAAWLFTIGYLHLHFWRGVLAVILWPYYLGSHFGTLVR